MITPPQINVPLTNGNTMTPETYAMLTALHRAIIELQTKNAALTARVVALEA